MKKQGKIDERLGRSSPDRWKWMHTQNPTLAPIGESPIVQHHCAGVAERQTCMV